MGTVAAALEALVALVAADLTEDLIPEANRWQVKSIDFIASYANYYVNNGAVIAPQFGDAQTDAIASGALMRSYPDQEVIMLNVDTLGELGGGVHCATQQRPAT